MAVHCQLIIATALYGFVFVGSLIEISTIIYAKNTSKDGCYLYVPKNTNKVNLLPCNVTIYSHAASAVYAVIMVIYHGYGAVVASRNNHVGRTMWVMPWLLINALLVFLIFISSVTYSIGYHMTCSNPDLVPKPLGCAIRSGAYTSVVTAELAGWICVLLWCGLIAIEAVRLRRNRRALSREVYLDPGTSEVVNIANIESTA